MVGFCFRLFMTRIERKFTANDVACYSNSLSSLSQNRSVRISTLEIKNERFAFDSIASAFKPRGRVLLALPLLYAIGYPEALDSQWHSKLGTAFAFSIFVAAVQRHLRGIGVYTLLGKK